MNSNKIKFMRSKKVYLYILTHFNTYIYALFLFVYIIYNIYTSPFLLCDDGESLRNLTQLKLDLSYEVSNYRHENVTYEYLVDIKDQAESLPMENRNLKDERYLAGKIHSKLSDMNESLTKIRRIESEIRKLEPSFQSPVRAIYYPRIGK